MVKEYCLTHFSVPVNYC